MKTISTIEKLNSIDFETIQEDPFWNVGEQTEWLIHKEDGEFYTPACIVKLIAEMIEPYEGIVYDPCCASGEMFVQSMKFVESHNGNKNQVSIVGQESVPETCNLAIRHSCHIAI